jgi:predicted DNA-binding transcriptional regulator AlpA
MTKPRLAKVETLQPYGLAYDDAARFLGVATKTLRNMVSRGAFPVKPRRLGSKPVFLRDELTAYLKALPVDKESLGIRGKPGKSGNGKGVVNGRSTAEVR